MLFVASRSLSYFSLIICGLTYLQRVEAGWAQPPPGVCDYDANGKLHGALGCSFDHSKLDASYINEPPLKKVFDFQPCPSFCFTRECYDTVCHGFDCQPCLAFPAWNSSVSFNISKDISYAQDLNHGNNAYHHDIRNLSDYLYVRLTVRESMAVV